MIVCNSKFWLMQTTVWCDVWNELMTYVPGSPILNSAGTASLMACTVSNASWRSPRGKGIFSPLPQVMPSQPYGATQFSTSYLASEGHSSRM